MTVGSAERPRGREETSIPSFHPSSSSSSSASSLKATHRGPFAPPSTKFACAKKKPSPFSPKRKERRKKPIPSLLPPNPILPLVFEAFSVRVFWADERRGSRRVFSRMETPFPFFADHRQTKSLSLPCVKSGFHPFLPPFLPAGTVFPRFLLCCRGRTKQSTFSHAPPPPSRSIFSHSTLNVTDVFPIPRKFLNFPIFDIYFLVLSS